LLLGNTKFEEASDSAREAGVDGQKDVIKDE
jgi:hypothetical protein